MCVVGTTWGEVVGGGGGGCLTLGGWGGRLRVFGRWRKKETGSRKDNASGGGGFAKGKGCGGLPHERRGNWRGGRA